MGESNTPPKKQSVSDRKRRAILDAAILEFDAGCFESTSMDQIAARAGVSKRTVYNHFCSKEMLFAEIRREVFAQIADIEYEYDTESPLEVQLETIATMQVEQLCSPAFVSFARISIPLSLRSVDVAKSTYCEFYASQGVILKWFHDATEDGRLAVHNPKFAARQFVGLLNAGVLWPRLIGGHPAPSKAIRKCVVESTVSMFLNEYAIR
ncbi:HTH-type transcriptional regulator AcrR [Thalassoglobus neptunius]|uniref:HTH-type transcriptional regulator AcrR n=1 Tax=Thalassoglobus neptunius TaxID=1938619 RepID=A0A5C5WAG2_9PLAN|nr:TetR/AcrR family transcriptional regulator [Thalassoglobus neptunius]TWT47896.1 HTH-type transcriptional regulator AcrR [Thalassoglobus neptunius]